MTYGEIIAIEPRVEGLRRWAINYRNKYWNMRDERKEMACTQIFKPEIAKYVGFYATRPELRTIECYEAVYRVIYDSLWTDETENTEEADRVSGNVIHRNRGHV